MVDSLYQANARWDPLLIRNFKLLEEERSLSPIRVSSYFGIRGSSDETSKFADLYEHSIANPGSTYVFGPFRYKRESPRIVGASATIVAYEAEFENTASNTYAYSDMISALYLGAGSIYHNNQGQGEIDPGDVTDGDLITDTARGATTITFVTNDDADKYQVGDWVLLHWFLRFNGFPQTPAFFEFNRVASVGDGFITLARGTKYPYKATAPDGSPGVLYGTTMGKARCLQLNRPGYQIPERITLYGGKGVLGGNVTSPTYDGVLYITGAIDVQVYDSEFTGFVPSMVRTVHCKNTKFTGNNAEMDKVVESIHFEDTDVVNLSQGTGVERFYMQNGRFSGFSQLRCKRIHLDKVDVFSQGVSTGFSQITSDSYPRESIYVENCNWYPNSSQIGAIQPGNAIAFTPDAVTATTMTINAANAAMASLKLAVDFGQRVTIASGTSIEVFEIEDIAFDGSNNLVLTGNYTVSPEGLGGTPAAQRNLWNSKLAIWGPGNSIHDRPDAYSEFRSGKTSWSHSLEGNGPQIYKRTIGFRKGRLMTALVNAYIERITIDVRTAYGGSDSAATLALSNQGLGGSFTYASINVKTAGLRRIDNFGTVGAQTGDLANGGGALGSGSLITQGTWCEELVINHRGDAGAGLYTDSDPLDLPRIRVIIEGHKP